MAGAIAEAFVEIRGDLSKFEGDVKEAMDDAEAVVRKNADDVFSPLEKSATGATKGIGGGLTKLGAAAGGALAAVQIGQFIGDGVAAAADLGESINAVNVVLGEGAESFLKFGESSGQNLGLTQAALNESVVPLAALLKSAGLEGDDLSTQLQALATRASDTGSVLNKDVNEVLGAFGAAVRGEAEPARALGVTFNDASVTAKALALGLGDATGEVSDAAKQQARLAIIMEQTDQFAGDFANTLETSLPNQMKVFNALLTDTSASLGQALIPALTDVLKALSPLLPAIEPLLTILGEALGGVIAELVPIIVDLVKVMGPPLQKVFQKLAPVVGDLLDALGPLIVELIEALLPVLPPLVDAFVLLLDAIIPLIPIITKLVQFLEPILPVLLPIVLAMTGPVGLVAAVLTLTGVLKNILPAIGDFASAIGSGFLAGLEAVIGFFKELPGRIVDALQALPGLVADFIIGYFEVQYKLWKLGIETIVGFVAELPGLIIDALSSLLSTLTGLFTDAWDATKELVTTAIGEIIGFVTEIPGKIVTALVELTTTLTTLFEDAANAATEKITTFISDAVTFFTEMPGKIVTALVSLSSELVTVFFKAAQDVIFELGLFLGDVLDFFGELPGKIFDAVSFVSEKIVNIGESIIEWIVEGIKAAPGILKDAILSLVPSPGSIISGITGKFGGGNDILNKLETGATGGFIDDPTLMLAGEAGRELLLPLTDTQRSLDLLRQSGLLRNYATAAPVTAAGGGAITLIIEGQPFTAMLASKDQAQALQLRAGRRPR